MSRIMISRTGNSINSIAFRVSWGFMHQIVFFRVAERRFSGDAWRVLPELCEKDRPRRTSEEPGGKRTGFCGESGLHPHLHDERVPQH